MAVSRCYFFELILNFVLLRIKESVNLYKLSISLKEANETDYWIDLLFETKYLSQLVFDLIKPKIVELLKLLTSIINTSKKA
jgi:four helix bundle protein